MSSTFYQGAGGREEPLTEVGVHELLFPHSTHQLTHMIADILDKDVSESFIAAHPTFESIADLVLPDGSPQPLALLRRNANAILQDRNALLLLLPLW